MKILFVIASLTSGGAERVLTTLANHWVLKGYEVTICTTGSAECFYSLRDEINILPRKKQENGLMRYIGTLMHIRKSIREVEPDIVISFMDINNVFTLLSSIGLNTPILISERNYFNKLQKKIWRVLRRITYPLSDGMVVLSKYDYEKYNYVKSKKIIFNPLNIEKILNVKFEEKEKLLISVGSLTKQKGFDMLIESLSNVEMNDWKYFIIGEGPEKDYLSSLISDYKLQKNVFLIGRKENIFEYYKRASIFVLSSRYEGFPNVLAEAMAHGCSCVAFDCLTGPAEIIEHNVNGYLVEANNSKILGQRMHELMQSKNLRKNFFDESLKIKKKLKLSTISLKWEEYLDNFIKDS